MALLFPDVPEIRLANPPLTEVVCQVRYPPILLIIKDDPGAFQQHIRHRFPGYGVEQPFKLQVPKPGSASEPTAEVAPRLFRFKSRDEQTIVSLAMDFYALSTTRYTHWADFVDDLATVHRAVVEVYQPTYATRIGLRYINRLSPSSTGLTTIGEICDLIRPELTAQLRSNAWSEPEQWLSQLALTDGEARFTLRTALDKEQDEPSFLLDFDYFEQGGLDLDATLSRVSDYHDVIYRAFRWCLPDKSLDIFGPQR